MNNTGRTLPNSPKFTFSVNASYDVPVSASMTGFIGPITIIAVR
jgi:iron complex outermembrane receptor protein